MVPEKPPLRDRRRAALARLAVLQALLLSPLGAPAIGFFLTWVCDLPLQGAYQCVLPSPLVDNFVGMLLMALMAGSLVLTVPWLLAAAGLLLGCVAYAAKTAWLFGVERGRRDGLRSGTKLEQTGPIRRNSYRARAAHPVL